MNAIITAATGYRDKDLTIFLRSVERHCENVKVLLIAFQQDKAHIENLKNQYPFLEPIYVRKKITKRFRRVYVWVAALLANRKYSQVPPLLQRIGTYSLHIVVERFYIMSKVLKRYANVFSNVLLTDCRDVVLQKNPFDLIHDNLVTGLESKMLADDPLNCYWISCLYGETAFERLRNHRIICAGVTLGPAQAIQKYLDDLCNEMWNHLPQVTQLQFGPDQAAHNYLIYEKQIPCTLVDNQSGFIVTVNLENSDDHFTSSTNGLLQINGVVPAIVHQYDRHPDLVHFFQEKYL